MTFIRKLLALPRRFRARRRSARLRSVLRQIAGMDDRKATGLISDARRKHLDRLPLTVLRLEHERAVGGRGDSGVDSEALWRFTASAGDFDWGEWAGRWANAFLARVGDASAPRGAAADPLKHLAALRRLSCDPVPEALRAVPEIARSRRADLTAGRAYLEYLLTAGREDEPVVAHALHAVCERPGPAAEELTRACKELLEWPESARNLGRRALGREEFGVARSEFIEAARLAGPGDSHLAAAAMGRIHLGLREWKAAIESFETALAASEVPDAEILLTVARLEELEATLGRTRIPRAEAERLLEALGERIRNSPPSLTAPGLTASSRLRHLRRMSGPRRACRDFVHGGGAACEASALRGWAVGLLTDLGAFGRSGPPEDQRTPARGRWLLRHGRFGDFESEYGGRLGSRVTSLPPSLRLLRADRLVRLGRGDDVLASLRLERGTPEEQAYNLEIRLRAMLLGGRNEDAAALHSGPEGVLLPAPDRALVSAWIASAEGRFEDLRDQIRVATGLAPGASPVWTEAGFCLLDAGADDDALRCFLWAADLAPWDRFADLGTRLLTGGPSAIGLGPGGQEEEQEEEEQVAATCVVRFRNAGRRDLAARLDSWIASSGGGS